MFHLYLQKLTVFLPAVEAKLKEPIQHWMSDTPWNSVRGHIKNAKNNFAAIGLLTHQRQKKHSMSFVILVYNKAQ